MKTPTASRTVKEGKDGGLVIGTVEIWMHRPLADDTVSDKLVQEFVIGVVLDNGDTEMMAFDLLPVKGMWLDLMTQIGIHVHSVAHTYG